ncbi:gamma-glutamyltransferase [Hellea balneolensis]|uniref:gamma-glutamyltransferase n=1 Tax=Hellea balneolensis TaxID=287478 RepID=UPI0004163151|nr:gamma-glutamyltransferase [Hellea balneolensis]
MFRSLFLSCALSLAAISSVSAKDSAGSNALMSYDAIQHPVMAENGMVSAQDRIAAEVGRDILARGGNAIDAAVATGFALAVTHPQAGNLGGGGFMMVHLAETGEVLALDFREMAPDGATRDMYLGSDGEVDNRLAQYSRLSAGVPGTVMGLLEALEKYGTMTRREVMGPSVRLAAKGFPLSYAMAEGLEASREQLSVDESSVDYFLGRKSGERFVQEDLAKTLRRIMKSGAKEFYEGKTAELIVAEMQEGRGVMTLQDLANYKTVTRKAVSGNYKGHTLYAMSPPSSGGVHIVQMLNILSGYNLKGDGHNSAAYLHKLIEVMRRAYADRSKYLGDPDFVDVPVAALTAQSYADTLRESISVTVASKSSEISPGAKLPYESVNTTHYSVIDKMGNAVSVTYTLNFSYGSGYSVDGAGFLLNNEMDDFSAKPGSPNGYGLIGGEANKIEPRKRPLSSMTPVIVKKEGKVVLVTGSPGGSTIITSVLQMVLNVIEWDMNMAEAVNKPRIHHQWLPDIVIAEPGISHDTLRRLEAMGHNLPKDEKGGFAQTVLGRVNSVGQSQGIVVGSADPRGPDSATAGY